LGPTSRAKWQGWRDSNPHPPDLESGALAVRATPLITCEGGFAPLPNLPPGLRRRSRRSKPQLITGEVIDGSKRRSTCDAAPVRRSRPPIVRVVACCVRSSTTRVALLRFFVGRVLLAPAAVLLELHAVRVRATILRRRIVATLTRGAAERDDLARHGSLLRDLGDDAGADRPPTLPDGEPQLLLHRHRHDQLDRHRHVVPRH